MSPAPRYTPANLPMAVAPPKPKAPKAMTAAQDNAARVKLQMHRRSRTGCFTCRLRRKKCDEGAPSCSACRHLGLQCEYKRPMWWTNNDQRVSHKNHIKTIIRRKKLSEKSSAQAQVVVPGPESPPGLAHSLPTSASSYDPTRSGSIDSQLSLFDFGAPVTTAGYADYAAYAPHVPFPDFSPYEVDVKTERQVFVNDIPTRRESTISTFSTYQAPPLDAGLPLPAGAYWEDRSGSIGSIAEAPLDFDLPAPAAAAPRLAMELDEDDQRLLDHFLGDVLPTLFPVLDTTQPGSAWSDFVLPALQNNKSFLLCCLTMSAQHYKATRTPSGDQATQIDEDIRNHLGAMVQEICAVLDRDADVTPVLEASLAMTVSASRFDDTQTSIRWRDHFECATSVVKNLKLDRLVAESHDVRSFNMTLTAWIDIVGSAVQGCAPVYASTYREKHLSPTNPSLGLRELTGCDDRVMYLISEIACLEGLKRDGLDDLELCQQVHNLGDQIGLTELADPHPPKIPYYPNGFLNTRQLARNMTAAFRLAARIYLCSLVPGFHPAQASCVGLVDKLARALEFVPAGLNGFDRNLAWVYLVGGAASTAGSAFRALFADRLATLAPDLPDLGNFGRVAYLLDEVWRHADDALPVSWRDVMLMMGWDLLLI